jgi:small subunit ribosomal protein S2
MISEDKNNSLIDSMFSAGAHFGFSKSRRHPSVLKFIFGRKNNVEIFDLEKTAEKLEYAKEFATKVASEGKQILFVGGKKESQNIIRDIAEKIDQPYVAGRWIGGTLTNFEEIRKRVSRLLDLTSQRDKGLLGKYTKKEKLMIEREIEKLEEKFGGIVSMERKPGVLFIIDADKESIARDEAINEGIPVISLSSSDCDFSKISYPIPANDSSVKSIQLFTSEIAEAYESGKKNIKK